VACRNVILSSGLCSAIWFLPPHTFAPFSSIQKSRSMNLRENGMRMLCTISSLLYRCCSLDVVEWLFVSSYLYVGLKGLDWRAVICRCESSYLYLKTSLFHGDSTLQCLPSRTGGSVMWFPTPLPRRFYIVPAEKHPVSWFTGFLQLYRGLQLV
jgi:hypothetical protein